jgi:hypothetical protein
MNVRRMALLMFLGGGLGFFYASSQLSDLEPVPPGIRLTEYTRYPAGRWELLRYGLAGVAGIGAVLTIFPQGR